MTNTQLKNFNRNIQRNNNAFKKLSAAGKRVAIAKDVLKQISAKVITPTSGVYLDLGEELTAEKGTELQKLFTTEVKSCEACAVGSMLFCSIIKGDNLTIDESAGAYEDGFEDDKGVIRYGYSGDGGNDAFDHLSKYFPLNQLKEIEDRFERGDGFYDENDYCCEACDGPESKFKKGKENPGDKGRLVAIMKNIIRNEGKFNKKEE